MAKTYFALIDHDERIDEEIFVSIEEIVEKLKVDSLDGRGIPVIVPVGEFDENDELVYSFALKEGVDYFDPIEEQRNRRIFGSVD